MAAKRYRLPFSLPGQAKAIWRVSHVWPCLSMLKREKREDSMPEDTSNPIIIPMEDDLVHTDEHPFCDDPACGCHEAPEMIAEVAQEVANGLLTPQEASAFVAGKLL